MSLERIIERIESDSREKVEEIRSSTAKETAEMVKTAVREAEVSAILAERKATEAAKLNGERALSLASLESDREILTEKRALVEEALERAMDMFAALPKAEYLEILTSMVISARSGLGPGKAELVLSESDRKRLGKKLTETVNAELETAGVDGTVVLSKEKRAMRGGFVLKLEKIEYNGSLEALVDEQRDRLEALVASILFAGIAQEEGGS